MSSTDCAACARKGYTTDHRGIMVDGFGQYVLCVHTAYTGPIGPLPLASQLVRDVDILMEREHFSFDAATAKVARAAGIGRGATRYVRRIVMESY